MKFEEKLDALPHNVCTHVAGSIEVIIKQGNVFFFWCCKNVNCVLVDPKSSNNCSRKIKITKDIPLFFEKLLLALRLRRGIVWVEPLFLTTIVVTERWG